MKIDKNACIDCGECLVFCPVDAILETDYTFIDSIECVECGVCHRADICPTDAFVIEEHQWPRSIRAIFSDPGVEHIETGIAGRGTEEIKTNDITKRYKKNQVNLSLELGRPGVGVFFSEVDFVTQQLVQFGVCFEVCNPIYSLFSDPDSGKIRSDVLDEKVMSIVLEMTVKLENLHALLKFFIKLESKITAPGSLNICSLVNQDGTAPYQGIVKEAGLLLSANGKLNIGIGHNKKQSALL